MRPATIPKLPGETGLWIFIFADLLLFTLFFGLTGWDMRADRASFRIGKAELDTTIGMINTVVLLTGSWAVVMGTRVASSSATAARYLWAAALTGILFLVLKFVEYGHHLGHSHSISENPFWNWYFFLTGYHAVHVMLGVVFLAVSASRCANGDRPGEQLIEATGCYWHLVDLLWIGIFLVLYLV